VGISLQLPEGSPWRTILRVCIILLAEAAVITMLRDSPRLFQVATVAIAMLALIVLEAETKIRGWVFTLLIGALGLAYLCFVGYAVNYAYQEIAIDRKLQTRRSEGLTIQQRPQTGGMTAFEYADWQKQLDQWRGETAKYLRDQIGGAAENRFLNTMGRPSYSYGGATQQLNSEINTVDSLGKNLQDIIDSRRR
jgi:hypothetical protein